MKVPHVSGYLVIVCLGATDLDLFGSDGVVGEVAELVVDLLDVIVLAGETDVAVCVVIDFQGVP